MHENDQGWSSDEEEVEDEGIEAWHGDDEGFGSGTEMSKRPTGGTKTGAARGGEGEGDEADGCLDATKGGNCGDSNGDGNCAIAATERYPRGRRDSSLMSCRPPATSAMGS